MASAWQHRTSFKLGLIKRNIGVMRKRNTYGRSKALARLGIAQEHTGGATPGIMFRSGFNRTGGYYGRYSGPSPELKFFDSVLADSTLAQNGTIFPSINLIEQGITESSRIGRRCTIVQINWRFRLSLAAVDAVAVPGFGQSFRILMYVDKQTNGATAAITDILEFDHWLSFRNLANTSRFQILYDRTTRLDYKTLASDGAGVVSSAQVFADKTFFKKCHIPLEFDGTSGAITEIRSNNIGVLIMTAENTTTSGINGRLRLRFSDK